MDRVKIASGEKIIRFKENGGASLYDANGQETQDPWLDRVISQIEQNPNVPKEDVLFTDDLTFVVYWPQRSFVWEGRTYNLNERPYSKWVLKTQDYAISFKRPDLHGEVFKKSVWAENNAFFGSRACVSMNGELLFLGFTTNGVALVNQQGEPRYVAEATGVQHRFHDIQKDMASGRIIFFEGFGIPHPFKARIWDFKKGTFTTREFDLRSLFPNSFTGGMEPVKRIKLETSEDAPR